MFCAHFMFVQKLYFSISYSRQVPHDEQALSRERVPICGNRSAAAEVRLIVVFKTM
jgi:hypothetical protein